MRSVKIKFEPFPEQLRGQIKGISTALGADKYMIIIDSTRSPIEQRRTLGHELAHVYRGHFDEENLSIDFVERDANRYQWKYYRMFRDGLLKGATI